MSNAENPNRTIDELEIGKVIASEGVRVVTELPQGISNLSKVYNGIIYPIGQFGSIIKIHTSAKLIFGHVARIRMKSEYQQEKGIMPDDPSTNISVIEADMFGEAEWIKEREGEEWKLKFELGVTNFPLPLQKVYLTPQEELSLIYRGKEESGVQIGEYVASGGASCYAEMNNLIGKHTAIVGSTGSGKSATVAAIVHSILDFKKSAKGSKGDNNWNPQIVIFDAHGEYTETFGQDGERLSIDDGSLKIPYWLLNYEEMLELLEIKDDSVNQKSAIRKALLHMRNKVPGDDTKNTVDSPTPYSLEGFISWIGDNEGDPGKSIKNKLKSVQSDSRKNFIMDERDEKDSVETIVKQFISTKKTIKIVDLSGIPSEIVNIVTSMVARTLFTLKLWQKPEERKKSPILLVCEEAHKYVPSDGEAQYKKAQSAISRIAKEGRKYGIGLILISQRPSEVDPATLSQCNSWIVLRITNEKDRSHVVNMLPDTFSGLTEALSSLRRREAIFTGEAAILPSRILINDLDKMGKSLPNSQDINFVEGWKSAPLEDREIKKIAKRWEAQSFDID